VFSGPVAHTEFLDIPIFQIGKCRFVSSYNIFDAIRPDILGCAEKPLFSLANLVFRDHPISDGVKINLLVLTFNCMNRFVVCIPTRSHPFLENLLLSRGGEKSDSFHPHNFLFRGAGAPFARVRRCVRLR